MGSDYDFENEQRILAKNLEENIYETIGPKKKSLSKVLSKMNLLMQQHVEAKQSVIKDKPNYLKYLNILEVDVDTMMAKAK